MEIHTNFKPLAHMPTLKGIVKAGLSAVKYVGSGIPPLCRYAATAIHLITSLSARNAVKGKPADNAANEPLIRDLCNGLTQEIKNSSGETDMAALHDKMSRLLPGMQALAKKSPEDFGSYKALIEAAGDSGLLDKDTTTKVLDTERYKPAETLGLLRAASDHAVFAGANGVKDGMLVQARECLLNKITSNAGLGLELESELKEYETAGEEEGRATARDKLFKAVWDQSVSRLKTDLDGVEPKTARETGLLLKLKSQNLESITERDLAKMGQLPGISKSLLNTAILARYAYKEGNIKTTTYAAEGIRQEVKDQIKAELNGDKIADVDDVRAVAEAFSSKGLVDSDETLNYLKNKLKTKIDDFLPPSGNDPWKNKMNQAIREGVKKDLFIAPEPLKVEMASSVLSGRFENQNQIFRLAPKNEMLASLKEMQEGEYQGLTRQLEELMHNVNESQEFVLKWLGITDDKIASIDNEIKISKQLDHPNLVKTYFAINDLERHRTGIVMDYCENGDFKTVLEEDRKKDESERNYDPHTSQGVKNIAKIILGAVKGLHHMHQLGYVHRDIKLENIFMAADDSPRVGDFGSTKELDTRARMTGIDSDAIKKLKGHELETKTIIGTAGYCAPETRTAHHTTPNQDTYSLGMAALVAMFGGKDKVVKEGSGEDYNIERFDSDMSQKNRAEEKIKAWFKDDVFNTNEGKIMGKFIRESLAFEPENRISYDESVRLLNDIINLKPKKSEE